VRDNHQLFDCGFRSYRTVTFVEAARLSCDFFSLYVLELFGGAADLLDSYWGTGRLVLSDRRWDGLYLVRTIAECECKG